MHATYIKRDNKLAIAAITCIFILLICIHETQQQQQQQRACNQNQWALYKRRFNKDYSDNSTLDQLRFARFCLNLYKITSHNFNSESSYSMAINHMSDYFDDEIYKFFGDPSRSHIEDRNQREMNQSHYSVSRFNEFVDVNREPIFDLDFSKNVQLVTPVRNQGKCGSCWAFATIAMLEGQQFRFHRDDFHLYALSEQQLIDCDYYNDGCDGGYSHVALRSIKDMQGLVSRFDYPYTSGLDGLKKDCKNTSDLIPLFKSVNLDEIVHLTPGNETLLQQVLQQYGPIAVGINVPYEFLHYSNGIFHSFDCQNQPNHMVTIVGYGTDLQTGQEYWKIKNSFGTAWGQKGYGLMSRNRANNCHIASEAYIVLPPKIPITTIQMTSDLIEDEPQLAAFK